MARDTTGKLTESFFEMNGIFDAIEQNSGKCI